MRGIELLKLLAAGVVRVLLLVGDVGTCAVEPAQPGDVAVGEVEGGLDPCVDGPPLASTSIRLALLVGAAMCPTCWCGAWCRWP